MTAAGPACSASVSPCLRGKSFGAVRNGIISQKIPEQPCRVGVGLALKGPAEAVTRERAGPGEVGQQHLAAAQVFAEKPLAGGKPVRGPAFARSLGIGHARALPDQVNDSGLWHIPAGPTGPAGAQAKIDLLEIHEVSLS